MENSWRADSRIAMSERREGHSRLHVENGKIVNERGEVAGAPQPPRQVVGEATVVRQAEGQLIVPGYAYRLADGLQKATSYPSKSS